jgi:hypothetical protein
MVSTELEKTFREVGELSRYCQSIKWAVGEQSGRRSVGLGNCLVGEKTRSEKCSSRKTVRFPSNIIANKCTDSVRCASVRATDWFGTTVF